MKTKYAFLFIITIALLSIPVSCGTKGLHPGGISVYLVGEWLLTKKITPKGTIDFGKNSNQTLQIGNDSRSNFLVINKDGKETLRLLESSSTDYEVYYLVDIVYMNQQMLRFRLKKKVEDNVFVGVHEMEVSEFMKEYDTKADTVRYVYERIR